MMILSSMIANLQQKMPSKVDFRVLAGLASPEPTGKASGFEGRAGNGHIESGCNSDGGK